MVMLILTMALSSQYIEHHNGVGVGSGIGGVAMHEIGDMRSCIVVGDAWENRMKLHPEYDAKRAFYLCVNYGDTND